ncbi:hypothetical protein MMC25_006951 [Agyrium rufum]|nr:hypothetical protein [Agyrium rufum]
MPILYRFFTHFGPKKLPVISVATSKARFTRKDDYSSSHLSSKVLTSWSRVRAGRPHILPVSAQANPFSTAAILTDKNAKLIVTVDRRSNTSSEDPRSTLTTASATASASIDRESASVGTSDLGMSRGNCNWFRFDAASVEENGHWPDAYELEVTSRGAVEVATEKM